MGTYNVHGGHNSIVPGANMYLNEVTEDRAVKNKVISYLKSQGHTVYDCTDESGRTQEANLSNIVRKCNSHSVDLDISIHLNSGRNDSEGDGKTGGVEVFCYDEGTKDVAKRIADAIHAAFGYTLRSDSTTPKGYAGVKINKGLRVLNSTKSPAILIECCFVDDKDDAKVWNSDKCARAIVEAVTGSKVQGSGDGGSVSSDPSAPTINFKYRVRTKEDGWLPEVVNLADYAGIPGHAITDIAIGVDRGSLWYQVHVKGGGWLPAVTGYDINDYNNGYAGNGKVIDAVRVYYNTPADYAAQYGYQKAQYRVSPLNGDYWTWQYDNETGGGQDGYAGAFGYALDKFQLF